MAVHHPRLDEAIEEYLRIRRARYSNATVANEGFVLRRFAAWAGNVQVRHLSPQRVAEWFYGGAGLTSDHMTRDGVQRPPIKASTHNFYRNRLASFFRFCVVRGWLRCDLLTEVTPLPVARRERLQPAAHVLLGMLDT